MGFDIREGQRLAQLEDEGIAVPIDDVTGKPALQDDGTTPITINVVGSLSTRYQKVKARNRGRALKGGDTKITDDEELGQRSLDQQTESVAACITGWSPGFSDNGTPFDFSPANALALLKAYPHIQATLEKAMDDHARFFVVRSTTSSE